MGILNVRPTLLGRRQVARPASAAAQARRRVSEGADILDVGVDRRAFSRRSRERPGELARIMPWLPVAPGLACGPIYNMKPVADRRSLPELSTSTTSWGLQRDPDMARVVAGRCGGDRDDIATPRSSMKSPGCACSFGARRHRARRHRAQPHRSRPGIGSARRLSKHRGDSPARRTAPFRLRFCRTKRKRSSRDRLLHARCAARRIDRATLLAAERCCILACTCRRTVHACSSRRDRRRAMTARVRQRPRDPATRRIDEEMRIVQLLLDSRSLT